MTRTSTQPCHTQDPPWVTLRIHGVELNKKLADAGILPWLGIVLRTLDVHPKDQPSLFKKKMKTGAQILLDLSAVCEPVLNDSDSKNFGSNVWPARIKLLSKTLVSLGLNLAEGYRFRNKKPSAVLQVNALNGLLVQEYPSHDSEVMIQFKDRLRVWLLFKAFEIAEKHNCFEDAGIIEVAWYLCASVDRAKVGWRLIDRLGERVVSNYPLDYFNPWVFQMALWTAVGSVDHHELESIDKKLLSSLSSLISGESTPFIGGHRSVSDRNTDYPVTVEIVEHTYLDQDYEIDDNSWWVSGDQCFEQSYKDESSTSEEQRISARSLLRQSAEEHHYLPSSWCYLQDDELRRLLDWTGIQLKSEVANDALGAALTVIALLTASSLQFVGEIPFEPRESGWYLDLTVGRLKRSVPRHQNAWTLLEADRAYIHPSADEHHFQLAPAVLAVIKNAVRAHPGSTRIGQLWRAASTIKLKSWFTHQMNEEGLRISSSMLANHLPYELFQWTGSVTIARLFNAHPQTTLTGSAAYVTASQESIDEWWVNSELSRYGEFVWDTTGCYVLGSQMVLLPDAIAKDVRRAIERVNWLRAGNPIDFHNAFTAYCVNMLLAATGSRPVRDPFESLADFSFNHRVIAIDDKADAQGSSARLVPLCALACEQIQNHFVTHLRSLSKSVADELPEFAQQLNKMLSGEGTSEIPLFFFLNPDGSLRHISCSESDSVFSSLFEWSLPPNLFRHHFIQALMARNVETEIVEGWAGHIEHGAASYGDYSERCWWDDAQQFGSAIESMLSQLGFESLRGWSEPVGLTNILHDTPIAGGVFGRAFRAEERKRRKESVLADVDKLMGFYLSNSDDPLSAESVNALALEVTSISSDNPMLKPYAWVRFDRMLARLDEYALSSNQTVPRIKRGTLRPTRAKTHFRLLSPRSLERFKTLTVALKKQLKSVRYSPNRVGGGTAAVLAATLLCLENRLSYKRLLDDVVAIRNFRLITTAGEYYIEYAEQLDPSDLFQPLQRHAVSALTAQYLDRALEAKGTQRGDGYRALKPLIAAASLNTAPREALKAFSAIVRDTNAVRLPGFMASALDGRTLATSLPLQDWYRFKTDKQLDMSACRVSMSKEFNCELNAGMQGSMPAQGGIHSISLTAQANYQRDDAMAYKKSLMALIDNYTRSSGGARNQLRTALKNLQHEYTHRVNSTVLSIGRWIDFRVAEGNKKRGGKALAQNTLKTYVSAISNLISVGHQIDITLLDSDGVTDLYWAFLEAKRGSAEDLQYFKERLLDYHGFVARHIGVEQPDWGLLKIEASTRGVSPGAIRTVDYAKALRRLQGLITFDQLQRDFVAFLFVLGYRYGLRPNEAVHLRRCDFRQEGDVLHISVLPYRGHDLKTKGSRRLIKNIEPFVDMERELIDRVLNQFSPLKADQSEPLYTVLHDPEIERFLSKALSIINEVLRATTGNDQLIYYHLRHTHLNRLSASVLDVTSKIWREQRFNTAWSQVRHLTLGSQSGISRRTLLGIGRQLGHVIPGTSLRSYNHLVTDHIDDRLSLTEVTDLKLQNARNIDELPIRSAEQSDWRSLHKPAFASVTLTNVLKCLEHIGRGFSPAKAMQIVNFPAHFAPIIEASVRSAESTLWFSQSSAPICGRDAPFILLERLAVNYWKEMIEAAERFQGEFGLQDNHTHHEETIVRMVGQSRQILMKHKADFELVSKVTEIFAIPLSAFTVYVRGSDPEVIQHLASYGLDAYIRSAKDDDITIDASRVPGNHYDRRYAALIYSGDKERAIKNQNSFVIALLACNLVVILFRQQLSLGTLIDTGNDPA